MRPINPDITREHFIGLSDQDKIKHLVNFALFAPSSHNTQPWLFKLDVGKIEVKINKSRELKQSDKNNRQLYLSIGAAVGNILLAAESYGLSAVVEYVGREDLSVVIRFQSMHIQNIDDSISQAILSRHSNREKFEDKKIPDSVITEMEQIAAAQGIRLISCSDPEQKEKLQRIVLDSVQASFKDRAFKDELSQWIKPSLAKYKDGMVGYNMGIPWLMSFIVPGLIKYADVSGMQRKMHQTWLEHAPTYVLLAGDDNVISWIKTGVAFERIAIYLEKAGIKAGIFGAPIETGEYYKEIQKVLNIQQRPLMFFRIGYADKIPKPSPRLDLEQIICE